MPDTGAPISWYPVALSADVGPRPVPVRVFGADYVLFRTGKGELAALARYCLHMGADLALAQVAGDTLRCNLHGWVYARDGGCVNHGAGAALARLAVHECAGVIHAWPGAAPAWPFPDLPGLNKPRAGSPRVQGFACPMHAIGLNGFDIWHYGNVHRRHVRPGAEVSSNGAHHLALSFVADVRPATLYDHLLVRLGYSALRVKLDYYGGNLIFVRNLSGGYLALLAMAPDGDERCMVYLSAFAETQSGLVSGARQRLMLLISREIALYFLKADEPYLGGMRPVEGLLVEGRDEVARAFWHWWRALPRIEVLPS